jgi:leucyl aminopeptidase (aminopeptidase T)
LIVLTNLREESTMDWAMIEVSRAATTIVNTCLEVKPDEEVAIVADDASDFAVVTALMAAVRGVGAVPTLLVMPKRSRAGEKATAIVSNALAGAQVIISPTSTALTFTPAFSAALRDGARAIVMTGVTRHQLTAGAGVADYREVYRVTRPLADIITAGKTMRVTSDLGSDLVASIDGISANCGASFATKPGEVSGFPSGEAWCSPASGTGNGILIADGSAHMLGILEQPIEVEFKDGRAIRIAGGKQADQLKQIISGVNNGDNLAELSIGTNADARFTGNITEDKKRLGTVHFAFGSSAVGGDVQSDLHLDLLITKPTVEIDGRIIVEKGNIVAGIV